MTVHWDCCNALIKVAAKGGVHDTFRDLVWMVAAWRKPGASMAPTRLSASNMSMFDTRFLARVAQGCGIPQLANMPVDVLLSIHEYSADSVFWRPIQAMVFFETVMKLQMGPSLLVPFTQLDTWARGQPIMPYRSSKLDPIIRITVDVHGIKKVERLPWIPTYTGECYHDRLFIIAEEKDFGATVGMIKVRAPPPGA